MNSNGKNILIVDDDTKATRAMAIRLQAAGYDVQTANDGITARQLAETNPPDLIISDILMPEGTGFAMSHRLQQISFNVPVLFVTASKDAKLRTAAKEFGGVGFVEKPYAAETLLAAVARALADRKSIARMAGAPVDRDPFGRKRILVVEDDPKIALSLSVRLRAADYDVATASDAATAANAVVMLWPDAIVMDITLPDGDGCTLGAQIKKLIPAHMPVIFITASKQPGLRERALEAGAAAFFEKPFNAVDLLVTIRNLTKSDPQTGPAPSASAAGNRL